MAYVNKSSNAVAPSTAPRSAYAGNKPATNNASLSKPSVSGDKPTHTLSIKCGEGDAVEFITLTGLFAGETKDGRKMLKGKPRAEVIVRLEDGREVKADQFFISAKDK
jgi:hypothetical protein